MRSPREQASTAEPVQPGTPTPDPPPPPGDETADAELDLPVSAEKRQPDQDVKPAAAGPEPPD